MPAELCKHLREADAAGEDKFLVLCEEYMIPNLNLVKMVWPKAVVMYASIITSDGIDAFYVFKDLDVARAHQEKSGGSIYDVVGVG